MAYNKATDLEQIQADVLGTNVANNAKITGLNKLKTSTKIVLRAINEVNEKLINALAKTDQASDMAKSATENVDSLKEDVKTMITEVVKETITNTVIVGGGGNIQNDEFVCEDNQVKFVLSKKPTDIKNILFYVNGVKYPKIEYQYNEADNSIEWLNAEVNDAHPQAFALSATDSISAVYMA